MNSFRIRHGQPEYIPGVGLIPAGPISISPSNFSVRSFAAPLRRHSRAGVRYESTHVGYRSLRTTSTPAGFTLGLKDSYGRHYGQLNGTIRRTQKAGTA